MAWVWGRAGWSGVYWVANGLEKSPSKKYLAVIESKVKSKWEKQVLHNIAYVWSLERWFRWTYMQSKNGDTESREQTIGPHRGTREQDELGDLDWHIHTTWRRAWQPSPVFLPGESHGQRSLVGYSPQGCTESDTTKATYHTLQSVLRS